MSRDLTAVLRVVRAHGPVTVAEIAARLPIPRYRIRAALGCIEGIERKRVVQGCARSWSYYMPHQRSPEDERRDLLAGMALHEAAAVLGVSYGQAQRMSQRLGIERRCGPRGPRLHPPPDIDWTLDPEDIAADCKVSVRTVYRWRARAPHQEKP